MKSSGRQWRRRVALSGLITVVALATLVTVGGASGGRGPTLLATFVPGTYSWTVPKGLSKVTFEVDGAPGGTIDSSDHGGNGGKVLATFEVTPGQQFEIVVGSSATGSAGGSNGGGAAQGGGGGGGGSDVRFGGPLDPSCAATLTCTLAERIVVAGGGGGGGSHFGPSIGGDGGGSSGLSDSIGSPGGTQVSPGPGGAFGVGADATTIEGGGGGGGWMGGGPGAGGSGYISPFASSGSFAGASLGNTGGASISG